MHSYPMLEASGTCQIVSLLSREAPYAPRWQNRRSKYSTPRGRGSALVSRAASSPLGLTAIALAIIVVGLGNFTDALDKLLVFLHVKPDALEIAHDDERSRFSRDLMRLAWYRLAAMNKYRVMVEKTYPQSEQDSAWQQYATVFDEWNQNLMVNIVGLQQNYNEAKSSQFESSIQSAFTTYHNCLQGVRHPNDNIACAVSPTHDPRQLELFSKWINYNLYCFVVGLPRRNYPCFHPFSLDEADSRQAAQRRIGSASRCAYRCVVCGWLWPRAFRLLAD